MGLLGRHCPTRPGSWENYLGAYAQAFEVNSDILLDDDSDDEVGDLSEGEVAIKLSRQTKHNIRERWAHSLIVNVWKDGGLPFLAFQDHAVMETRRET